MTISERTFRQVVLEDFENRWELHHGRLREKPGMTFAHNRVGYWLGHQLGSQLDPQRYDVRVDAGHVHRPEDTFYIPDVFVFPLSMAAAFWDRPNVLEVYEAPLPFVAEVWSPSTGGYDVDGKLPEYRRRGDAEIWRLHPYDRTVIAWRRRPDGDYDETTFHGGSVRLAALPEVMIDLDALFAPPPLPPSAP
jgi:Uma2 family endonuclease